MPAAGKAAGIAPYATDRGSEQVFAMSNEHQHTSAPAATSGADAVTPAVKPGFWSLGRRFAALLSIAMVAGFGPMLWFQARDAQKQTFDLAMAGNATISALLADRAGGGMRWDRKEAIEDAYRGFATAPGSQIANIRTFDNAGKTTTEFDNKALRDYDLSKALNVDKARLAAGKTARHSDDHHVVMVVPVFQGKDKTRVGTMAVAWSTDKLQQDLKDSLLRSVAIAGGVVAVLLALIIVLFKTSVEKPLGSMIRVMGRLVAGEREIEVPGQRRRDDIGAMARMVNTFKENALALDRMAEERERTAAEKATEDARLAREKAEEEARHAAERREMEQKASAEKRQALLDLANSFEARIKSMVHTVSAATTEMRATAQSMTSTAEITTQKSGLVAASSEEATKNVQTVAAGSRRAVGVGFRDQQSGRPVQCDHARRGRSCGNRQWPDPGACRGGPQDRRGPEADLRHRRADQPARAQRHHRGGARG